MMFADINRPLPMVGEEFFEDGSPIRFGVGLRQVFPGDLVVVEWPLNQSLGAGNWVKGLIAKIADRETTSKYGNARGVYEAQVHLAQGWHMGAFKPELGEPDENGERQLTLVPEVKVSNLPWHWDLRTDDVPGWNIFLVGHNCEGHESRTDCMAAADRKVRFDDARKRRTERTFG